MGRTKSGGARRASAAPRGEPRGLRLDWPGRSWAPSPLEPEACLEPVERVAARGAGAGGPPVELAHVDAAGLARDLAARGLAGQVRLVYVDPPFLSGAGYVHEARLDGPADGRVARALAYDDRWQGPEAWLDGMAPALDGLAKLLARDGTLWVHLDWRAAYLARCLLDEILGPKAFVNEIVWRRAPNLGRQARSGQFGRTLDTLLVYGGPDAVLEPPTRLERIEPHLVRVDDEGRPFTAAPRGDYTDASVERLAREGRIHRTPSGKVYVKYFLERGADGAHYRARRVDALWTDVPALRHAPPSERTGYPTQKPEALLARVVACATRPGDLVVDAFAGSGTTGVVAHALGRRVVLGDVGAVSQAVMRARFVRAGVPVVRTRARGLGVPAGRAKVRIAPGDRPGERLVTITSSAAVVAVAAGPGPAPGAAFEPVVTSERGTGARPSAVALALVVPASCSGPLEVHVHADDGTLTVHREGDVPAATGARARARAPRAAARATEATS